MTLPAGRSVSICTKSTGHLEEAVLQVLVTLDVFWAERVNLQEKYDDPCKAGDPITSRCSNTVCSPMTVTASP